MLRAGERHDRRESSLGPWRARWPRGRFQQIERAGRGGATRPGERSGGDPLVADRPGRGRRPGSVRGLASTLRRATCWDAAMDERDPFGRLPGEDPLELVGKPTNGTHAAAAEAVAAEQASSEARADLPRRSSRHTTMRRPRSSGRLDSTQITTIARRTIKSTIALAVLVVVGGGLVALVFAGGGSTTHSGSATSVAAPAPAPAPAPARRAPGDRTPASPSETPARSLLTRRAFAPALAGLGKSGLGRLRTLTVRPRRIDAQLLTPGGRLRSVQVASGGAAHTLATSGAGFGALPTIPFARVDAAAPARLARSASQRLGQSPSNVDYVVLLRLGSALTWSVYMRDGKHFLADAHGRIARRAG
jgi:hypothetical protein